MKDAIDQALILRGSRDFDTTKTYADFLGAVVNWRNRLVQGKLEQETLCLGSLPPAPVPEYVNYQTRVRKWSTIQVAKRTYSVPRLIGREVQIRLYADWVEVYYKGHLVECKDPEWKTATLRIPTHPRSEGKPQGVQRPCPPRWPPPSQRSGCRRAGQTTQCPTPQSPQPTTGR